MNIFEVALYADRTVSMSGTEVYALALHYGNRLSTDMVEYIYKMKGWQRVVAREIKHDMSEHISTFNAMEAGSIPDGGDVMAIYNPALGARLEYVKQLLDQQSATPPLPKRRLELNL